MTDLVNINEAQQISGIIDIINARILYATNSEAMHRCVVSVDVSETTLDEVVDKLIAGGYTVQIKNNPANTRIDLHISWYK